MQTTIPVNLLHAATRDKALRKLLAKADAAAKRVAQALDDQAVADGAVADYVVEHFPATAPADAPEGS